MKMNLAVLLLAAATAISTVALPTPSEKFMHSLMLDESGNYTLFWKFDDKSITFEVHVRTTGWVGFGLSPNGGMTGSDVVIGWVTPEGKAFLKDRYAAGFEKPMVDPHQDWFLTSGKEEAGVTVLKFHRALDTKDCAFDRVVTADTLKLIWAYRDQDPSDDNDIMKHAATSRGAKSVNLLEPVPNRESPDLASAASTTYRNPAIVVPSTERTVYYCEVFRMPNLTERHHIIKFAPAVQKENAGVVHHIVVFGCHYHSPDIAVGISAPCFSAAMPADLNGCRYPLASWAAGGDEFYFPDDVGISLGGPNDPNVLILETHFDNPDLRSGIVDSSGMTLWYTPRLRRHDAGVFIIGSLVSPQLVVPPGARKFSVTGICHSECTSKEIPTEGVTALATLLHAHLLGRQIRVRQFRGDKEIADLGRDNNYAFDYQQVRVFNPTRQVKPGDTIVTECIYDSTALRDKVTFGGLATTEEMCHAWILYYPRVDMDICNSAVSPLEQLNAMNPAYLKSLPPNHQLTTDDYMNGMNNVTWTPAMIELEQKTQRQSNMSYLCFSVQKDKFTPIAATSYPANLKFAADPEPDCFPVISAATTPSAAIWLSLFIVLAAMLRDRLL